MNLENLSDLLKGQKPYRIKQALAAVYQDLICDWNKATILPIEIRERLNNECPLQIKADLSVTKDQHTIKALIFLEDGERIEAVLMRHRDGRNTVCVSSQVGCPLACAFCATGTMGFKRNLAVDEILAQVLLFARYLKNDHVKVTNVVFMGMGEPFLNYDNVVKSIRMLNSQSAFGIGARKIAVSTSGIVPGIDQFAKEDWQVNLAISLHAPDNGLRSELMPINHAHPLEKVLKAVDRYIAKNSRRVMFEYLMIKGVNDSEDQARQLAKLLHKPLHLVNLIKYNPTGKFIPSDSQTISRFMQILLEAGIPTTQRYSYGHEISAACGQLAAKNC